ncbi:MAG TPA: hypothetical protein VG737_08730 [Cyclobacteriaceae bacterium]|nr:hypothetical protein [Cyclobacteriaceae bacterium]
MKKFIPSLIFAVTFVTASAVFSDLHAQNTNVTHRIPMFENDDVKVWKTVIVPNSPLSMHRHEHGRTIVVLKGGTLTIQQDTGEKKKVEWETGKAYWLDADPPGNKKHADVNETNETIEVMVVENKKDS